jgi:hypothetical protein
VFRHRAFALYWFSRIASILSFHMLVVAVGWQLYELTGSAFDLGLLGWRSSVRCWCSPCSSAMSPTGMTTA